MALPDSHTVLGRILRAPLRVIPKTAILPILRGPARGLRWQVGAGAHGIWLGLYESSLARLMSQVVRKGSVCFDLGAHTGYYTLVLSRLVGPAGRLVAFEPLPANVALLRKHIEINNLRNVGVIEAAVSDRSGRTFFEEGPTSAMGHVSPDRGLTVRMVHLDGLVGSGELPTPDFIKVDVEGQEYAVLRGAARLLEHTRPMIFIELHGTEAESNCKSLLQGHGYRVEKIPGSLKEWVARPD